MPLLIFIYSKMGVLKCKYELLVSNQMHLLYLSNCPVLHHSNSSMHFFLTEIEEFHCISTEWDQCSHTTQSLQWRGGEKRTLWCIVNIIHCNFTELRESKMIIYLWLGCCVEGNLDKLFVYVQLSTCTLYQHWKRQIIFFYTFFCFCTTV